MVGWHHHSTDMGLGGLLELVMDREAWCCNLCGLKESDLTELQHKILSFVEGAKPPSVQFSSVQSLSCVRLFATP